MTDRQRSAEAADRPDRLFSDYGELHLLLDADPNVLREAIRDSSPQQIREIIQIIEDQINDTHLDGNTELLKRHMYVWLMCTRILDSKVGNGDDFVLDYVEWEYDQFY